MKDAEGELHDSPPEAKDRAAARPPQADAREDALDNHEAWYHTVFTSSNECISICEIILDEANQAVDYWILDANLACERMTGISNKEAIGRTARDVVPGIEQWWIEAYGKVAQTGQPIRLENYMAGLDRWFDAFAFSLGGGRFAVTFRDISNQVRAHEQVQSQRSLLQIIFDTTPVGIALYDRDMRLIDFNDEYESMIDPRVSISRGQVLYDLYPATLARKPIYARVFAGESVNEEEVRYPYSSEEVRYRDSRYRPVRDANGEVIGLLSTIMDVTERKLAEEVVRDSEARFRAIADLVPDILWRTDAQGLTEWHNQRFTEYTGALSKEGHRQDWSSFVHPEDRANTLAKLQAAIAGGEPLVLEERIRGRDGEYRWFLVQACPILDDRGQIVHWFGAATDVHEQRMARDELEERVRQRIAELAEAKVEVELQHHRLRDIFMQIPALVGVLRGPEHRYELVNPTLLKRMKKREEEMLGKSIGEAFPEAKEQGWIEVADQVYRSGEPRITHEALAWLDRQGDGSLEETYWNGVTMPLRNADGQIEGLLTHGIDVTDQVLSQRQVEGLLIEREEEIARRKEVEEELHTTNRRLRELSARLLEIQEEERRTVARELHDEIGQYLTGLHFMLQASGEQNAGPGDLQLISALAIVDDLTARVRELALNLRPSMLDDAGLAAALLWHTERYALQTGIQVVLKHQGLEARLPAPVETAVYRIIQEALTNVARHASTKQVTVQILSDGNLIVLVEDAGKGFDVGEVLARHSSTGILGMRERVELLGGQFTLESAPGAGARVIAEIPLNDPLTSPQDK
ncbi:MAG TPA: PAS domain-containing protein [Chloroflexia bacterium]|nr:PAS domain-containing protein [Chloroflexia bacterium]